MTIETIQQARDCDDINVLLDAIPYTRTIGMKGMQLGEELVFHLPPLEANLGNPTLPALHGGCIGGFMENAAIIHVISRLEAERVPKIVDFSLDYLRAGRFQDTYATCDVVRQGRKVVNVAITAWQSTKDEPIAVARAHLLL
ncbi:Uncharacterised protein [BD1-7 clade bacterium]|uniref:Thioesterase domain-containing protein n=1 Tax=BD1-7 clade bacterium TaxID=2029982 RepID=A0A5S9QBM9_9GAMM|nr:Uncharacterised protein [BD1-7 clade bacterium]CAA0084362.1 Uncharacterised protein [BD1-7 clade bacterium]CAA0115556.1 Uncharacterised protein [BD1-7 clade bacterium]